MEYGVDATVYGHELFLTLFTTTVVLPLQQTCIIEYKEPAYYRHAGTAKQRARFARALLFRLCCRKAPGLATQCRKLIIN